MLGEGRQRGLTTGEQLKTTGWLAHRPLAGRRVSRCSKPHLRAPTLATPRMQRPVKGKSRGGARGTVRPNGVPGGRTVNPGAAPARPLRGSSTAASPAARGAFPALQRRPGGPHGRLTRTALHTKAPGRRLPAPTARGAIKGPSAGRPRRRAHHRCA